MLSHRSNGGEAILRTAVAASLVAVLWAAGCAAVGAEIALRPAQVAAIETAVHHALTREHRPSIVIAVNRNSQRVFARVWGKRDVGGDLPATVDTLYQYGSITKQFTAMAIFLLAQDGKLALDDRIAKHLPAFAGKPVSIRQLLIHTSGLPDPVDTAEYARRIAPQVATGPEWILARSAPRPLTFAPGTKAQYDNTGYVALARIVERAAGMPFDRFLQTRILDATGMGHTVPYRYLTIHRNAAEGYLWWGRAAAALVPNGAAQGAVSNLLVHAPPWNLRQVDGAGYLVGDAASLQRWDDALLAGKFLRGKWRTIYFAPGKLANGSPAIAGAENKAKGNAPAYCYGGLAKFVVDGHTAFGANGGTFGFSTFTATIPDRRISVTMLSNLGMADNSALNAAVLKALLE